MPPPIHHSRRREIISVGTLGVTIAVLVYAIRITRLCEAHVASDRRTHNILAKANTNLKDRMKGKKKDD